MSNRTTIEKATAKLGRELKRNNRGVTVEWNGHNQVFTSDLCNRSWSCDIQRGGGYARRYWLCPYDRCNDPKLLKEAV